MRPFFKKKGAPLGQHFLTNRTVAQKIAEEGGAQKGATVLEIGPGKGMLTAELLKLGATVVAIEKDPNMVHILRSVFSKEIETNQLHLIEGDARTLLTTDFETMNLPSEYSVAANIPYYITGELVRLLLTAPHQPRTIVLLMQKEVAERIARSKKESLLSLSVKAYGVPHYIQTVKAGNFNPPPNVDSAVLAIENISRKNFSNTPEGSFFEILHIGFGQKRKTLLGNLKKNSAFTAELLEETWKELNLDARIRSEDVPLETWLALTARLSRAKER